MSDMHQKCGSLSRLRAGLYSSALLGLSALLAPMPSAWAQTCGNLLSAGPVISPISGSKVVVGQTITITRYSVASANGNCLFENGVAYYAAPSGGVSQTLNNFTVAPGGQIDCNGTAGGGDASCLAFTTTYVVNAADAGRTLVITLPPRGQFSGSTETYVGVANEIHFFGAADCDGFDPANPGTATGPGSGTSAQRLILVHPGISITKICDTNCFPFGTPISFHGSICNTGDVTLVNITVTDSPPVTVTFAATTSSGRAFNPATGLTNGECVTYFGSYTPPGSGAALCGPFTDTVIASGTVSGVSPAVTISATNSATCPVCTSPCIQVTKICGPASIDLSQGSYTVSGSVTNCGNVPLTNIVVTDTITNRDSSGNVISVTTVTIPIGSLAPGTATNIPTQTITVTNCGSSSDFFSVVGSNPCGGTVSAISQTCTTIITNQACITVSKVCGPTAIDLASGSYTVSGSVSNCGTATLTGVNVTDTVTNASGGVSVVAVLSNASIPAHQAVALGPVTITVTSCGPSSDFFSASGNGPCGPASARSPTCTTTVTNQACITVSKVCGPTAIDLATGSYTVSGSVSNCGTATLTGVNVTDTVTNASGGVSVVAVLSNASIPAHTAVALGPVTITVTTCGPSSDFFSASGNGPCGPASAISGTCTTTVTNQACIGVSKVCGPASINLGGTYTVSGSVTNCGNLALTGVNVTDTVTNGAGVVTVVTILSNATIPAHTAVALGPITLTGSVCGPMTDFFSATGNGPCGPASARSQNCTTTVICLPVIKVYKQVVCLSNACLPFSSDLNSQKTAAAVRVDGNCPAFCYRITVTNQGNVTLSNVTVVDNSTPGPNLNFSGCVFATPITLAPGASANCTISSVTHCSNTVNVVTATGTGQTTTGFATVSAMDTNTVTVVPISVICTLTVSTNGGASFFAPSGCATQFLGNSYIVRVGVTNNGQYALQNVTITSASGFDGCLTAPINLGSLAIGAGTTRDCTFTCTTVGESDFSVSVSAEASQAAGLICAFNAQGVEITTQSSCSTCVVCIGAPAIKVYKQVVCWTNSCEPFNPDLNTQKSALAVRVDPNNCPAFCYRITVTNLGNITLTSVTVVDNSAPGPNLNLSGCIFATPITLAPAGQPNSSATCTITDVTHCNNTTNVVTATGVGFTGATNQTVSAMDTNTVVVQPISVICTITVSTNGGATFFAPTVCATQSLGNSYIVRIAVTNNGNYALQNVIISNVTGLASCLPTPRNIGSLGVGAGATIDCSFTCATPGRSDFSVSVVAEASQALGHVCVFNSQGVEIVAQSQCSACVVCTGLPKICVTKQIACATGVNSCGTFGPSAIGVRGDTLEPTFCYLITVTNCGQLDLTNVSVVDDKYGDLTADFACVSPVFHVGDGCTFTFQATIGTPDDTITFVTNTVEASGTAIATGQFTNAFAHAVAEIVPASVVCTKEYTIDGGPLTNNVTLTDQDAHTIVWYVIVHNTGLANLENVQITDVTANLGCVVSIPPFRLDAGDTTVPIPLCTNSSFACSNAFSAFVNEVAIFANEFTYTTNHIMVCAISATATASTNVFVQSQCQATILCTPPNACRVTGGGRQDAPIVCPADVRYVTHGGQVGAPVGDKICVIDTNLPNYFLGNPCIHGRWTHVRHGFGGNANEGNFHARFFDTLDCACLDTNLNPATCQYGPGTVIGGRCNPGDRLAGPEPRKAPANKIAFTGVGDWQCEKGGREPRSCLFRVDIEDRGEPGNDHALDLGHKPGRIPDRYRIRIWVLTAAELAELQNGTGADPYLIHFRDCISACNGINYQDGGALGLCGAANSCSGDTCTGENATGTITFPGGCPVRTPNIDDGGELLHGNHQIHPMIMQCDPANPKGPGLAKP